ncbi:MAG TPA: hypothetical protein VF120_01620 [Ktedonobacterales bacterium]
MQILRDTARRGGMGAANPGRRVLSLTATLLLSLLVALAGAVTAAPVAAHPSAGGQSLTIVVPKPSDGVVSGPVGTNVSIKGTGAPNSSYQLGYALKSDQCLSGFQQLQASPVTTKSDGTFSATFAWPSSGTDNGSSYYVCAQNTGGLPLPVAPTLQSNVTFKVLAQDAPNIALDVAASSGTPNPSQTPPPSGSYYAGSSVQITGANFLPGGTNLQAYVTTSQDFSASDTQTYQPLVLSNGGTTFSSHSNGAFSVTATMPPSPRGAVFLHVVSTDAADSFPPSLIATQAVTVLNPQPTPTPPTPSPSTTTTTTASATPKGSTGTTGNTPDPGNVLAVIGLSGLSIILFIVGIILMTSASAMARTPR